MVNPQSAIVLPRGEQIFEVEGQAQMVEWSLNPPLGRIIVLPGSPGKALYQAPLFRWSSADVKITAKVEGDANAGGEAAITLSATPSWLTLLSAFWVLTFGVTIGMLFYLWPAPPPPIGVEVYPPAVTLSPGKVQQFEARVLGAPDQTVIWTSVGGTISPTGLFTAPSPLKEGETPRIIATLASDSKFSAAAQVIMSTEQLVMTRSLASAAQMAAGSGIQFEAHGDSEKAAEGLSWITTEGTVDKKSGLFTVPEYSHTGRAVVTAFDPKNPNRKASAVVLLRGGFPSDVSSQDRNLTGLLIAFWAGALGAALGALRSFVGFVGNRKFVASWGVYYLSRPVFGAGLALLVHFGYRMGAFNASPGSSPMDPASAAFIGGIVGLFADDVLGKLKDFVDRFLQMSEPRTDKMKQDAGTTAAAAPAPSISSATASRAAGTVVVTGQNYTAASKVHIDGTARTTTFISATSVSAPLDATKNVGDDVKVVVVNSPTAKSAEQTVKVVA
ncbi:hypothetical protein [uncultured Paludibaculum sp.]|uniref:hypothetical protein n=1 Tax=uncultured Paludibaculum sp. TaxID=1765020 RepID=UPI002AAA898E|nr:hypothetical protein [uncultured Paludibaculum sp.]